MIADNRDTDLSTGITGSSELLFVDTCELLSSSSLVITWSMSFPDGFNRERLWAILGMMAVRVKDKLLWNCDVNSHALLQYSHGEWQACFSRLLFKSSLWMWCEPHGHYNRVSEKAKRLKDGQGAERPGICYVSAVHNDLLPWQSRPSLRPF